MLFEGYPIMDYQPVNRDSEVTTSQVALPPIILLPLVGGRACLDFVNTIDWRLRPDHYRDTLLLYSDLLAFSLRLSLISADTYTKLSERALRSPDAVERVLCEARAFRDAFTALIDDLAGRTQETVHMLPRAEAINFLEGVRRKAHASESMIWKESHFVLSAHPEEEGLDRAWLMLVRDAEDLLCSEDGSRLRVCAADGCGWVFLDTSKNGTRRWCSMNICGNREKARRFKTRGKTQD
jgi:predicted RNA-binding Zn ribbon-like protein